MNQASYTESPLFLGFKMLQIQHFLSKGKDYFDRVKRFAKKFEFLIDYRMLKRDGNEVKSEKYAHTILRAKISSAFVFDKLA